MAPRRVGSTGDTITGNRVGQGEGLLQLDVLLPGQFYALRTSTALNPERALMLAVLEDAVRSFFVTARDPNAVRLHEEARGWLFGSDRTWPFSFLNVCDALDLDADYLRGGLQRRRNGAFQRIRPRVDHRAGTSDVTGESMRWPSNPTQPRWVG